jgi:hypothetical protein
MEAARAVKEVEEEVVEGSVAGDGGGATLLMRFAAIHEERKRSAADSTGDCSRFHVLGPTGSQKPIGIST